MAMMVDNGCTPLTNVTSLGRQAEWDCSYSKCTADLNMQKDELSVLQKDDFTKPNKDDFNKDDLTKPNKDDLNMQKEKLSVLNENSFSGELTSTTGTKAESRWCMRDLSKKV